MLLLHAKPDSNVNINSMSIKYPEVCIHRTIVIGWNTRKDNSKYPSGGGVVRGGWGYYFFYLFAYNCIPC